MGEKHMVDIAEAYVDTLQLLQDSVSSSCIDEKAGFSLLNQEAGIIAVSGIARAEHGDC